MKNKITFALLTALLAVGCGKKEADPIIEITQVPQASEPSEPAPQAAEQEKMLERSYNLIDNTTPSQLVCEDLLRNFIDQRSGRARALRGQTDRIRQLCGKAPAFQGDTEVVIGCREVDGGDYAPQAIAKTKYRCQ